MKRPQFSKMTPEQFATYSRERFDALKAKHDAHVAAGERLVPVHGDAGPAIWVTDDSPSPTVVA